MVAEALRKPDRKVAMLEVFQGIEERGAEQTFCAGYRQFQQFVAHSIEHWRSLVACGFRTRLPRRHLSPNQISCQ